MTFPTSTSIGKVITMAPALHGVQPRVSVASSDGVMVDGEAMTPTHVKTIEGLAAFRQRRNSVEDCASDVPISCGARGRARQERP